MLIRIILTSLGSIAVLFVLTKIIGYQQISQLSMFDYVNGITIGSIAAEMATALEDDFREPLIAMVVYSAIVVICSIVTNKSRVLSRFIDGKPCVLYDNGEIVFKNLKKAKLSIDEFLCLCRCSGYFKLSDIQTAVLEANGQISFLPTVAQRPVSVGDLQLNIEQDYLVTTVVIDGKILEKNLIHSGKNEVWLRKQLSSCGFPELSEVLLATCDRNNKLHVYKKDKEYTVPDILI